MSDSLTIESLQVILDMSVNKLMTQMDTRLDRLEDRQLQVKALLDQITGSDIKDRVLELERRVQENELLDREQMVTIQFLINQAEKTGIQIPAPVLKIINHIQGENQTKIGGGSVADIKVDINGGQNQNQFGDNNSQTQNNQLDTDGDWRKPFDELGKLVADKQWPDQTPQEIKDEFETPKLMVDAAAAQAETDINQNTEPIDQASVSQWQDRFSHLMPLGIKIASSVGLAVADSFVKKSPVVAGLQALFKSVNEASQ